MTQKTKLDDLEEFVDEHGLSGVIQALVEICRDKADQGDYPGQDEWDEAADELEEIQIDEEC